MKKIIGLLLFLVSLNFAQELGAKYLIVTNDNFYNAILPLAQWKHKKGMRTKVAKLSEIGSTSIAIRNYIVNAYNTWLTKPEFLLLVGAPNYLPFPFIGFWNSDNYYTNMDGDIYNEILSGRLTVHNITEAQTVVNKILKYERTPDITDTLWFKKGCLIVNEDGDIDDTLYWHDAKYVASRMVANGYVYVDTFSAFQGDDATSVILAANNGRSYVLYRGSATNNWYWPFDVNPDNLANGNKLPIVVSATCFTLGTGATPAAAERWFLTGTPAILRGASGYFATTTGGVGIAYLRSAVAKGFFDGVFVDNKRTFGEACENGRIRVYTLYGDVDEYRGFTTVGDPELNLWTNIPQPMQVTHDSTLALGTSNFDVFVKEEDGITPIDSALVCLMGEKDTLLYETGYTDISGVVTIAVSASIAQDTVWVTVTARNHIPYEGYTIVKDYGVEEEGQKPKAESRKPKLEIYPNPFSKSTVISYSSLVINDQLLLRPRGSQDRGAMTNDLQCPALRIYDATGRLVRDFSLPTSYFLLLTSVEWNGTDDLGRALPTGVYFVQLSTQEFQKIVKVILLK